MRAAGFVLAGGLSSRMGRDKAFLRHWGVPLVVRAAAAVADAAGSVTILGDPDTYGHFGWPALADTVPGLGPMGALLTALENTRAEWNVLVACDMPDLSASCFESCWRKLLARGPLCGASHEDGFEPLCAVYRRTALLKSGPQLPPGVWPCAICCRCWALFRSRVSTPPASVTSTRQRTGTAIFIADDRRHHYIEFRHVYKTFDEPVLVDVSFWLDAGKTLAIIGRSGVGKSVSLGHIMGFLKPDKGQVMVGLPGHYRF